MVTRVWLSSKQTNEFFGDIVCKNATNRRNSVVGERRYSSQRTRSAISELWVTLTNDSAIDHVTCHDPASRKPGYAVRTDIRSDRVRIDNVHYLIRTGRTIRRQCTEYSCCCCWCCRSVRRYHPISFRNQSSLTVSRKRRVHMPSGGDFHQMRSAPLFRPIGLSSVIIGHL